VIGEAVINTKCTQTKRLNLTGSYYAYACVQLFCFAVREIAIYSCYLTLVTWHFRFTQGKKTSLQCRSMPLSLSLSLSLLNFEVTISWRTFRWSQSCVIPPHTPTISNSSSGSFKGTARVWRMRSRRHWAPRGFAMREVGVFWGGGNNVKNIQNSLHEFCRIIRHVIHTIVVIFSLT